jgi:hypothetical protein
MRKIDIIHARGRQRYRAMRGHAWCVRTTTETSLIKSSIVMRCTYSSSITLKLVIWLKICSTCAFSWSNDLKFWHKHVIRLFGVILLPLHKTWSKFQP